MSVGLVQIKKKISSLKVTNKITKAMQLIAAAKFPKSRKNLDHMESFYHEASENFYRIRAFLSEDVISKSILYTNIFNGFEKAPKLLIVISPNKGFCGNLVTLIQHELDAYIANSKPSDLVIISIGSKMNSYINKHHNGFKNIYFDEDVVSNVIDILSSEKFISVECIYSHFLSLSSHKIEKISLFPANFVTKDEIDSTQIEGNSDDVLKTSVDILVKTRISSLILHNEASELSTRMIAMDNAHRNGVEMLDKSILQKNKIRQTKITNELIDIVSSVNV